MNAVADDLTQTDEARLRELSKQSHAQNAAFVEIVYHDAFVRFDISAMQALNMTPEQIVEKYFAQAFAAVGLSSA